MATPSFRQFHPRQLKQHSWLLHFVLHLPPTSNKFHLFYRATER